MRTIDGVTVPSVYDLVRIEDEERFIRNQPHVSIIVDYTRMKAVSMPQDSGGLSPMTANALRDNFYKSSLIGEMIPMHFNCLIPDIQPTILIIRDFLGKYDF